MHDGTRCQLAAQLDFTGPDAQKVELLSSLKCTTKISTCFLVVCESVSLPSFIKTLRSRCCPTRLMEWITSTMITKKSVDSFLLA